MGVTVMPLTQPEGSYDSHPWESGASLSGTALAEYIHHEEVCGEVSSSV